MSHSSSSTSVTLRALFGIAAGLTVCVAAFLLVVGLGPDRLPFPPSSDYSDAATSHWPNALFLRRAVLEDHTFPLWRPLIMSGQPFAANPLNKIWYPLQWLVLIVPPAAHLNLLIALHLVLAGTGAWLWSRRTGLSAGAALLVAGGYAFAPRIIAALGAGHLDLVYAAGWFPWLLWSIPALTQPDARPRSALWSALFATLCILADVRLGAYALATALAYALWRWWSARADFDRAAMIQLSYRAAMFALLTTAFTAPQWIALLLYRTDLSRSTITLDDAAFGSLSPGQWLGLLIGDHGGNWESLVYVGVSIFTLAVVALLKRPRQVAFWWLIVALAALYAMGNQFVLWPLLNRLVPALRWWRVPPRVWLVPALILPYLAGWGADALAAGPSDRRAARLSVVALLGGGMVCGVFSTLTLSAQLDWTATVGIFALPAVALVMLLAIFGKLPARTLLIVFALVVLIDVLWIDRTLVKGRHEDEWLAPHQELAAYLVDAGATRVYSPSYSLPQQAAAYWEIPQFGGVDPFQMQQYVSAAKHATGVQADGYSVTLPAYQWDDDTDDDLSFDEILAQANHDAPIRPDLLAQWMVSHVVSAFEIDAAGLELETQIGDVYVYRNTLMPAVTINWQNPNTLTVRVLPDFNGTNGTVYAAANGRWNNTSGNLPGLPGDINAGDTYETTYSASEVVYGLGALLALLLLSSAIWWRAAHA